MKRNQVRDSNSFHIASRQKDVMIQDQSVQYLQKKKVDPKSRGNYSIQQLIQEQQVGQIQQIAKKQKLQAQNSRNQIKVGETRKRQSVEPRKRISSILKNSNTNSKVDTTFNYATRKTNNLSFNQSYYHPQDASEEFQLRNYYDAQDEQQHMQSNMSFKDHFEPHYVSKPSLAERHNEYLTVQKSDKNFDRQNMKGDSEVAEGRKIFSEGNTEAAKKLINFELALEMNSSHPEGRYLLGVCYLSVGNYQKAIEHLTILIDSHPLYKKNVYILVAIAQKKENDLSSALNILTKAISKFPKYYDAFIYRGKLFLRMKDWNGAFKDFQSAVSIQNKKSIGYIGQAEALRFLGNNDQAISCYTLAIGCNDGMKKAAIMKRAVLYIETKSYQLALDDLNQMLQEDSLNSEALYFKGFIQNKQKNQQDALLSFEQAIKHNNSKKAVTKALYEIAKIKIEQRDFYSAFHELCRAEYLDVDQKALEKFRIFTEGVTFLMKRKYAEGVEHLTNLINNFAISDFLKPLLHSYRAYGSICLAQHGQALADLQTIEKYSPLDKASTYNKVICEGIINASQNQFEQSLSYFLKAQKLIPNKMEPYFYKATTLIRFCNKLLVQDSKRGQYLNDALRYFNKAVEINQSNANLYFYRGLLNFCLTNYEDALQDLEKAIEKSEDNVPNHFYVRGLIQGCLKNYKQALNDFSITINLDDKLPEAYLNRGKIFQLVGDRNSAFYDIQKFLTLKPTAGVVAGNILFHIGAYDDAIKAYSGEVLSVKNTKDVLYLRAKCHIILKELNNALNDLDKIYEVTNDQGVYVDFQILSTLKTTSSSQTLEGYADGLGIINSTLKKNLDGDIFKKSDMIFFKAVYLCYIGDYKKVKLLLKESYELKEQQQSEMLQKQVQSVEDDNLLQLLDSSTYEGEQEGKLEVQQKLLEDFDFTDRTYNVYEYLYNTAILELVVDQKTNALDLLNTLIQNIPEDHRGDIQRLISLIKGESQDFSEIVAFPNKNRLCSIFPGVKIKVKGKSVSCKLSFCLPSVHIPSMNFCFDQALLVDVGPGVVENRPEAPWIKRGAEGVIFTDNIQHIDDLDLMSEKRETTQQCQEENQEDLNLEGEMFNQNHEDHLSESLHQFDQHIKQKNYDYSVLDQSQFQIDQGEIYDPQTLKQQLMLDSNVTKKLDSLIRKNQ